MDDVGNFKSCIFQRLKINSFSLSKVSYKWSKDDKGELIEIEGPSQLKFIGTEKRHNLARTTKPISKYSSSFYFEATIINSGDDGEIAIGLTKANPNTRSGYLPGWRSNPTLGIGYHGDDGGIFHESNKAIEHGEKYKAKDVVGCYLVRTRMSDEEIILVQFTKNGNKTLTPRIISNDEWYPTIGIGSPGAIVDTNFSINGFTFDVKGM